VKLPLGLHLGERLDLDDALAAATYADEQGLDSVWVPEGRLTRDAIAPMAVMASRTRRVKIASSVVNNRTRNAALMAVTFKTLDELAPGRAILGIGAWWEPLAGNLGLPLRKPLKTMREYVTVVKRFFANEVVDFDGEFVRVHGARFDSMYRENRPVDVPVYIGAVGMRMLELSGEIADGVNLDFLLPVDYLDEAVPAIGRGIAKRTDGRTSIDMTQLVACSVDDEDPRAAVDACKEFLTLYLMQQPHIAAHCGVEPELVDRLKEIAGWPARPEDVRRAMALVPDALVHRVTACGSTAEAYEALERYHHAGVRVPVLSPLGRKIDTIHALVKAAQ